MPQRLRVKDRTVDLVFAIASGAVLGVVGWFAVASLLMAFKTAVGAVSDPWLTAPTLLFIGLVAFFCHEIRRWWRLMKSWLPDAAVSEERK